MTLETVQHCLVEQQRQLVHFMYIQFIRDSILTIQLPASPKRIMAFAVIGLDVVCQESLFQIR